MILKQNEKYNEQIRYVDNLDAIFDILIHYLYFDVDCEVNDHIFPLTYKNGKIVIGDIDDEPLKTYGDLDDINSWYVDMSEVDNEENLQQLIAKNELISIITNIKTRKELSIMLNRNRLNKAVFQGFLVDGSIETDLFTPYQKKLIKQVFTLFKTTLVLLKQLEQNDLNNERLNQTFRVAQMALNEWVYDLVYYEFEHPDYYNKEDLLTTFEDLQEYNSPTILLTNLLTVVNKLHPDELNSFDKQEIDIREVAVDLYEYL